LLLTQLCCVLCTVMDADDLASASHPVLLPGVTHLDPKSAVFEAMLEGWVGFAAADPIPEGGDDLFAAEVGAAG
jgi:hypothetical protein